MEASYHRHDISDNVRALREPRLPGQRGQWGGICLPITGNGAVTISDLSVGAEKVFEKTFGNSD